MPDDSRFAIRLLTLGVALLAFGLGCHFWADRFYRTAGLAIGAVQLCRYFLDKRIQDREPEKDGKAYAMDEVGKTALATNIAENAAMVRQPAVVRVQVGFSTGLFVRSFGADRRGTPIPSPLRPIERRVSEAPEKSVWSGNEINQSAGSSAKAQNCQRQAVLCHPRNGGVR